MRQAPDAGGTGPTKASIDARVKVAKDLAAAMKETTNALWKGGADMLSALQTIAAAESLQKRKTEHAEASSKKKTPKLSAMSATSDPPVIRFYKAVHQHQGVPVGRTYEELPEDLKANAAALPFIIRRGRSIMKSVFREESVRMAVSNVSESFREKPGSEHY